MNQTELTHAEVLALVTTGTMPDFSDVDDYHGRHRYLDDDDDECDCDYCSPQWLHPQCVHPCLAIDLGTCCMYPESELVREVTDAARTAAAIGDEIMTGEDPEDAAARLEEALVPVPGLLDRIMAVLPGLHPVEAYQFICPVERMLGAIGSAGLNQQTSGQRYEAAEALTKCSHALWAEFKRGGAAR